MLSLPSLPDTIRLRNSDLAQMRHRGLTVPIGSDGCITCGDHRTFLWRGEDDQPAEYQCDCKNQNRAYGFFLNAGVGKQYQRLAWRDAAEISDAALVPIVTYRDRIDYHVRVGTNLVLWSPLRGTGKTMLANLLLKDLLVRGVDGYCTRFTELMNDKAATFSRDPNVREARLWYERRITNTTVLVIDDIGQERRVPRQDSDGNVIEGGYNPDWAGRLLEEVVRARDAAELPTIITTNLTPEALYAYHDGVMSLLARNTIEVEVSSLDYRMSQERKARSDDEMRVGMVRPVVW